MESVKPRGCTWHSSKWLLVEPRREALTPTGAVGVFGAPGQGGQKGETGKCATGTELETGKLWVHSIPLPTLTEHPLYAELA